MWFLWKKILKKWTQKKSVLTQYGHYAKENSDQGMNTDSHPSSSSFALRGDPLGITAARLQRKKKQKNKCHHPCPISPYTDRISSCLCHYFKL